MSKKYRVYLTYDEFRIILNSLIDKKNNLIMSGHYTDGVDEVIEKVLKAKIKKVRIREDLT